MGNLFASPIQHENWYEIGNEYFEPLNQIQVEYIEEIKKMEQSESKLEEEKIQVLSPL